MTVNDWNNRTADFQENIRALLEKAVQALLVVELAELAIENELKTGTIDTEALSVALADGIHFTTLEETEEWLIRQGRLK